MKPNMLVVQYPYNEHLDPIIENFCESHTRTHWVYLVRPESAHRDDTPAGVRFLTNPLDKLPAFPVDLAIAVGGEEVAAKVKERYPDSETVLWGQTATRPLTHPMFSQCRRILRAITPAWLKIAVRIGTDRTAIR